MIWLLCLLGHTLVAIFVNTTCLLTFFVFLGLSMFGIFWEPKYTSKNSCCDWSYFMLLGELYIWGHTLSMHGVELSSQSPEQTKGLVWRCLTELLFHVLWPPITILFLPFSPCFLEVFFFSPVLTDYPSIQTDLFFSFSGPLAMQIWFLILALDLTLLLLHVLFSQPEVFSPAFLSGKYLLIPQDLTLKFHILWSFP